MSINFETYDNKQWQGFYLYTKDEDSTWLTILLALFVKNKFNFLVALIANNHHHNKIAIKF